MSRDPLTCSQCGKPRSPGSLSLCWDCHRSKPKVKRMIVCGRCGKEQPFYARGMCRLCHAKTYRESHKAEHAAYERARRATNPAQYREADKRRRQTDKRRQWKRVYHQTYYQANREHLLTYQRKYRRADPERRDNYKRRRRARVLNLPDTLTVSEWHESLEAHNHACAYCGATGVAFHREHKIPASKGGGYTAENIVPACPTCNLRKQDMTDTEFREYLKLYPR